jgi:hypothetical protein
MFGRLRHLTSLALLCPVIATLQRQAVERQLERLGAGLVAMKLACGALCLGWRLLAPDPDSIGDLSRTPVSES